MTMAQAPRGAPSGSTGMFISNGVSHGKAQQLSGFTPQGDFRAHLSAWKGTAHK